MTAAKGLEGITIENSEICKIDGGAGRLVYRGYDIHDLTSSLSFNRIRDGQEPIEPREDLSHAANHLYMLSGRDPDAVKVDALNKYLILLADHGKNPSTFTARFVASTWADAYSAVVAAICALKGLLHGGAPAPVLKMLQDISTPERAEEWIRNDLKSGRRTGV